MGRAKSFRANKEQPLRATMTAGQLENIARSAKKDVRKKGKS
ncbi:hypothetical protein CSB93_2164 [Pseudomonas paraeruginosa]|uniref:Uncharacterized protein n=1 Tax=Pseudomonas paraeruginosa TaxID=2994495 RepID=A0A2R3IV72_9PSED|nr:hypothetical protein CSB93_2164 [Pseudomonas paraeruginosa]AWE89541.1 hypothetical protein CSC28_0931 [Pseudomonas paraeruginosa]